MISFVDEPAADGVTGSMVYIKTPKHKILLDAGFYQSNNMKKDYEVNNRTFKSFKYKEIDTIILSHNHGDHIFLAPSLYKKGCTATTYIPEQSRLLLKEMLLDCADINTRDAQALTSIHKRHYESHFEKEDVFYFLTHTKELAIKEKIKIDDELSIRFIPSGHLLRGCQIELYVTVNNRTEKILYTGDLGNQYVKQPFTEKLEYVEKANYVIAESTYGGRKELRVTQKERNEDLKKLKQIVQDQVLKKRGRVVIPVFAQARAQNMAYFLYQLFHDDENFDVNVYVDSPLAYRVFQAYADILEGEEREEYMRLLHWDRLKFVLEWKDSDALVHSNTPCIILSTSGMCSAGRVTAHIESLLDNENATILFAGYSAAGTIGAALKNGQKTIKINKEEREVKCNIAQLTTMSSHISYEGMVEYYSSIQCNALILHHGDLESKVPLARDLDEAFRRKYRSTKIYISDSRMKLYI